jgi:hypothetical protein
MHSTSRQIVSTKYCRGAASVSLGGVFTVRKHTKSYTVYCNGRRVHVREEITKDKKHIEYACRYVPHLHYATCFALTIELHAVSVWRQCRGQGKHTYGRGSSDVTCRSNLAHNSSILLRFKDTR